MGVSQIRNTFLEIPRIRIYNILGGLLWGPPFKGNYNMLRTPAPKILNGHNIRMILQHLLLFDSGEIPVIKGI